MNSILDILPQESMHTAAQEPSSNPSPIHSLQHLNRLVSNFEVNSILDSDLHLMNSMHFSQEVARQFMLPQFQGVPCSQTSMSFGDNGLFMVSSGKRSPPMGKDGQSLKMKRNETPHTQQKKYLQNKDRTQVHRITNINSLFKSYPKSQSFNPPSFSKSTEGTQRCQNGQLQIEAKGVRDSRIFVKQIQAQRNFFKMKHTKVRVYNCKQQTKNQRYFDQLKESFTSEKINECVPQRFITKNIQDHQKNSQQQITEQVITDSQPVFQASAAQPVQEPMMQLEDLISSLECKEPSFLPSSEDAQSNVQQQPNSRNFSQDSRRSGRSNSSSDEERELFRIFSGLHVLTVNNQIQTQQQPNNSEEGQTIYSTPLSRWQQ